ncbi:MAG: hypothetical protein BGP25_00145 [Lysobacterales bacterium 63-13]|nr:MAG: hypothetical protein BGP25_00145 [Xanthomonadales bacterium 63-13]
MATSPIPFFISACDRHGRSPSGEVLIAGRNFESVAGHPGLRYGCGADSFVPLPPAAERWLVLQPAAASDFTLVEGGARVFRASIEVDGSKDDVLAFLQQSRARNLPYLGKRVQGGTGLLAVGGADSELECSSDAARLCGGTRSRLVAGDWSLCVAGNHGQSRVGRFGIAAAGTAGKAVAGDDAIAVAAEGGTAVAGAYGLVVGKGNVRLAVGREGAAVGTRLSLFQGDEGAVFIVRLGQAELGSSGVFTATVGQGAIEPGKWYRYHQGAMALAEGA